MTCGHEHLGNRLRKAMSAQELAQMRATAYMAKNIVLALHTHGRQHRLSNRATSPFRHDPTKTGLIRRSFEAEMERRFRDTINAIWQAVVEQDVFGIETEDEIKANAFRVHAPKAKPKKPPPKKPRLPPKQAYKFDRDRAKVAKFKKWLEQQARAGIIGVQKGAAFGPEQSWATTYIQSAYQRGMTGAGSALRGEGVTVTDEWMESAFMRPVHADRIGTLYTRQFEALEGVTEEMADKISKSLASSLIEGKGARETARALIQDAEMSKRRARMIARTETINAHAEATLNAYEEAEAEGVELEAEWLTAQDDQVCPKCQALGEGPFMTIDEARGRLPAHPNCRCAWAPVVMDPLLKSLR